MRDRVVDRSSIESAVHLLQQNRLGPAMAEAVGAGILNHDEDLRRHDADLRATLRDIVSYADAQMSTAARMTMMYDRARAALEVEPRTDPIAAMVPASTEWQPGRRAYCPACHYVSGVPLEVDWRGLGSYVCSTRECGNRFLVTR